MLNPTPLLSSLRFRVAGDSQVAGRATVTAHATPRPHDPRHGSFLRELHELGTGAHHYQLEVDQERGVLLAVTAIRDEQPFHKITTLAIRFDEPIPAETFQFEPPKAKRSSPPEIATVCSTSRSPKRSSAPRSPFSCQTACPPAGRCTARSSKPPSGHHRRRRSR